MTGPTCLCPIYSVYFGDLYLNIERESWQPIIMLPIQDILLNILLRHVLEHDDLTPRHRLMTPGKKAVGPDPLPS